MNLQVLKPIYRKKEILDQIEECLDKSWTGAGFKTDEFETKFKEHTGFEFAHLLNSATAGLDLAVRQLKEKFCWMDDDEVITTPITFVSTNHAILYNQLNPVFADIDQFGCLDPLSVKEKITNRTKAIMFVALGGNRGQLDEIIKIAKENNLKLILDAAHACGTKNKEYKQIGLEEGIDVTVFSFQSVKNLPTCDSGMICWKDKEMDAQSRRLSWLGISKSTFDRSNNNNGSYKWSYEVPEVGFKMHSNSIVASMALVGLKYLEQDNAYRRLLADTYTHYLKDSVDIVPMSEDCIPSRHIFQILVDGRDEIMLALNQFGIYPGVHYRDNTIYSMYEYANKTCPFADMFSSSTISLPLHMHMTIEDVKYVCESLLTILKGRQKPIPPTVFDRESVQRCLAKN